MADDIKLVDALVRVITKDNMKSVKLKVGEDLGDVRLNEPNNNIEDFRDLWPHLRTAGKLKDFTYLRELFTDIPNMQALDIVKRKMEVNGSASKDDERQPMSDATSTACNGLVNNVGTGPTQSHDSDEDSRLRVAKEKLHLTLSSKELEQSRERHLTLSSKELEQSRERLLTLSSKELEQLIEWDVARRKELEQSREQHLTRRKELEQSRERNPYLRMEKMEELIEKSKTKIAKSMDHTDIEQLKEEIQPDLCKKNRLDCPPSQPSPAEEFLHMWTVLEKAGKISLGEYSYLIGKLELIDHDQAAQELKELTRLIKTLLDEAASARVNERLRDKATSAQMNEA